MLSKQDRAILDAAIVAVVVESYTAWDARKARGGNHREPTLTVAVVRDLIRDGYSGALPQAFKDATKARQGGLVNSALRRLHHGRKLGRSLGASPDNGMESWCYEPANRGA